MKEVVEHPLTEARKQAEKSLEALQRAQDSLTSGYRITKHPKRDEWRVEHIINGEWVKVSSGMRLENARELKEKLEERDLEWIFWE